MKLTEEQSKIVAENHSLIYWYINLKHLNIEDYYDLLAIELCNTVLKHDPTRGTLTTYFKLRADGLMHKEYKKKRALKRTGSVIQYIEEIMNDVGIKYNDEQMEITEWMNVENGDILKLKSQGYSQTEIANELGVSQSYVSKILKKLRKDYDELYRQTDDECY